MNTIQQIEAAISELPRNPARVPYAYGVIKATVNGHEVRVDCAGQYQNAAQCMCGTQRWFVDGKRVARAKVDAMVQA